MIKRIAHIVIVVLLLVGTTGVTYYKHYCSGNLISKTFNSQPENCCGDECNGCHNESKQLKITDNYDNIDAKFNFKTEITKILETTNFTFAFLFSYSQDNTSNNLFYKVKTCEKLLSSLNDSAVLLQIFRL